ATTATPRNKQNVAGAIKAWLSEDAVTKQDLVACAPAWWRS
ncbi:MAG: hypothetical protein QOI08_986, partial [Actinomycetota bacterium]|nr:hypothetical protein [Actinomycetota bacterium]